MQMIASATTSMPVTAQKQTADYVFYELTRSICPECRRTIDAQVLLRDNKVYMRKRCPDHGLFEGLIYGDAEAYVSLSKHNKPGTIPLKFSTDLEYGCPHDCGLCPDHQQHACVGIIEVNSACDMDCPLCFADAGAGYSLTLGEVEDILDRFVEAEGSAEMVQFSGGEPSIHPQIIEMMSAAKRRDIGHVMLNTNGKRIATDDRFLAQLAEVQPWIYFQFDGFESETYAVIRGEPDILPSKMRALDRLADAGCMVILVPAIERGVNEHEIGAIIQFAMRHPAVKGVNFQPAFHAGRHMPHDPMERITIPDILQHIESQMEGAFVVDDFLPVPCCFPTCNAVTYAYLEPGEEMIVLPRVLEVEDYIDYVANRVVPDFEATIRDAVEGLWSSSAVPGSVQSADDFAISCAACGLPDGGLDLGQITEHIFMIMLQDFLDPYTFNQKTVMKCCKEILLPDGKQIPFCAYNNVGYREQARVQLAERGRARRRAEAECRPYVPTPLSFSFR
jgi:uncharacterized radical SAM superfamily Fe-S cluster-containing enzyme